MWQSCGAGFSVKFQDMLDRLFQDILDRLFQDILDTLQDKAPNGAPNQGPFPSSPG